MRSKPLSILFSVVIAFTLWLYVITVVSPNSSEDYPGVTVVLDGGSLLAEKGLMLASDDVPTVKVTLEGNRSDLVNINKENLTVVADLSNISTPGTHQLSYTVTPPGNTSVKVTGSEPQKITVEVVEKLSAKIPVRINYTGNLPEGFIMDKENAVLDYAEIPVEGPKEVIEQIDHAAIEINCDGRTETIVESQRFKLCDAEGNPLDVSLVSTEVAEVRVEVKVSRWKKVKLVLKVIDGGGATADTTAISIEPSEISISGSEAALEGFDELVLSTVNLADTTAGFQKDYEITLPDGIKNESGITSAYAIVSFPELTKRDFTITNFKTINVAEGMKAELLTQQLVITVRGPQTQVNALRVEDITVTLDLNGVVNSDTIVPTITFGENFPDVGVLGKPTVSVTVAEPSIETSEE